MAFFGHPAHPHIITNGRDNRHGLNLFVGTSVLPDTGTMRQVTGTMLGMTDRAEHFYRHGIMVRALDDATPDHMISQTGIYRLSALKDEGKFDPADE